MMLGRVANAVYSCFAVGEFRAVTGNSRVYPSLHCRGKNADSLFEDNIMCALYRVIGIGAITAITPGMSRQCYHECSAYPSNYYHFLFYCVGVKGWRIPLP